MTRFKMKGKRVVADSTVRRRHQAQNDPGNRRVDSGHIHRKPDETRPRLNRSRGCGTEQCRSTYDGDANSAQSKYSPTDVAAITDGHNQNSADIVHDRQ